MSFDGLLQNAVSLTSLASIAATFAAVVAFTFLRSSVGLMLCLAALLAKVLVGEGAITYFAGIALNFNDLVYLALCITAVLRWMHLAGRGRLPAEHVALLLLSLLMLINFVRGVPDFGPQAAGVELRRPFYFFAGAAYFGSFEPLAKRTDWILRAWIGVSLVVCAIAVQRFMVAGGLTFTQLRVIDSGVTLVLAQALIICLYLWMSSANPRLYRNLALVLLPFVVIMQHRTVWVVLMVSFLLILLWEARLRSRLLVVLAAGAVLTSVGVLVIYGDRGSEILEESATETGTFEWRVTGWKVLLQEQLQDRGDMVIGRPMGAGYERFMNGIMINFSPHNYYVELLLAGGGVGVLLLLFIYISASLRLLSSTPRPERSMPGRLGVVLLVTHLVFYITYAPLPEQSVMFGLGLSLLLVPGRSSVKLPTNVVTPQIALPPLRSRLAEDPGA